MFLSQQIIKWGKGSIPLPRAFGWLRGLWKKKPAEPSFRLVRMKKVPTVMRMYFEPYKETEAPITSSAPGSGQGLHGSNEEPWKYRSIYRPPTTGPPSIGVGSNLPQTAKCYVPYHPGAGFILQPAFSNALEDSEEALGKSSSVNVEEGHTDSNHAHGRLGKKLVDQRFANQELANDNSSGTALWRNTAPKHAAIPNVEQTSQATYRESPDAMTVEHQDSAPCSQPLVVVKPKPTASDEEQRPDERDMLPSRQQHQVPAKFPEIATRPRNPAVMWLTPPAVLHSPSLKRRPGYRSLRGAAVDMGERKVRGTPLLNHRMRPSTGLSDLPGQLLTKHYSH